MSETLTAGARVFATGRLEQRSWETAEGDKRSKIEIVADQLRAEPEVGDGTGCKEREART